MTLYEQIRDFTSLGFTFEFSKQPMNMTIKVKYRDTEKETWLPQFDHCDEETITRSIAFMIEQINMTRE